MNRGEKGVGNVGVGDIDLAQLFSLIKQGGPAAMILAVFLGAASLVREVRGGKISTVREGDLLKKLEEFRQELDEHRREIDALKAKLDEREYIIRILYRQRDQARTQAEKLGYDAALWPADPVPQGAAAAINPAATQVLPPLDLGPPGGGTP